jgi:phage terminase small subunit
MDSKLTPKQQRFVQEYLVDFNATQAAIRAGYSPKVADRNGPRLLRNAAISAAVQAYKDQFATAISATWLLNRLEAEVSADIADLYAADGRLKPVGQWPKIWRQGLVTAVEVEDGKDGRPRVSRIRFSDRVKRLELLGKHITVGAFVERRENTVPKDDPVAQLLQQVLGRSIEPVTPSSWTGVERQS